MSNYVFKKLIPFYVSFRKIVVIKEYNNLTCSCLNDINFIRMSRKN